MKVKELIKELEKLNGDTEVCLEMNGRTTEHKDVKEVSEEEHFWDKHKIYVIK